MTPQENFSFLNAYLGRMNPFIWENGGYIDKYIGDAIMALFPTSPEAALDAAIAMLRHIPVYEVFDADPPELIDRKIGTREEFEQAVCDYHAGRFESAVGLFKGISRPDAPDRPVEIYLARCLKAIGAGASGRALEAVMASTMVSTLESY